MLLSGDGYTLDEPFRFNIWTYLVGRLIGHIEITGILLFQAEVFPVHSDRSHDVKIGRERINLQGVVFQQTLEFFSRPAGRSASPP